MKKLLYLVLTFCALISVSCRLPNQNESFYDIRIGVILPLSGEYAESGKAALDGIETAVREIHRTGGIDSRKIQLIIKNSANNAENAEQMAKDMIEKDNIVALVGTYSSNEAVAVKLEAEKYGVPFVASMASYEKLVEHSNYTFQCAMSDEFQGAALASYLVFNRKYQKVAVMFNTDRNALYQRSAALRAAQAYADFSSNEPLRFTYSGKDESFANQIKQCIREDVDVIILPEYAGTALRFISEARRLGYRGAFAGCDAYDNKVLTESGENLGICFFSTPYYSANKSEANIRFQSLMKKYHKRSGNFAEAMGYDSMVMLIKSLKGAYTPEEIAMNLKNMRSFNSVCGMLSYHKRREVLLHPVYIFGFSGGKKSIQLLHTVDAERLKNYRNREKK